MLRFTAGLVIASALCAQTSDARFDPGLAAFVPADTVLLTGVQMDALRVTPLYQQMVSKQRLDEFEELARRTGFDPRRDVRQLLMASNGADSLLIARGAFQVKPQAGMKRSLYNGVTIHEKDGAGYAVIDPTIAVAGAAARMRQAIDQKLARAAQPALLLKAKSIPGSAQVWAVATGFSRMPIGVGNGAGSMAGLMHLLRTMDDASMWADLRSGVVAKVTGTCRSEEDAKKLRDTVRGFIGLARLSVPEKQPEMLRFYDGFRAEQRGTVVDVDIKAPAELLDAFLKFTGPGKR